LNRDPKRNIIYCLWFVFYIFIFGYFTAFLIIPFYVISFLIALSPHAERIWRFLSGVRPLRLKSEKERLRSIFFDVYIGAVDARPRMFRGIKIFILETMDINAYAFGRETLILTKGSIDLLSDECIAGLMAHELGHFANGDTRMALLLKIGNLPMSLVMQALSWARNKLKESRGFFVSLLRGFINVFYFPLKGIDFLGELILMHEQRKSEYLADSFAFASGYGKELAEVLSQLYQVSFSKPQSIKEMMRATHPHITKRIERLEDMLY